VQRRPWGDGSDLSSLNASFMDPIEFANLVAESNVGDVLNP
jgi:hypothetical protein